MNGDFNNPSDTENEPDASKAGDGQESSETAPEPQGGQGTDDSGVVKGSTGTFGGDNPKAFESEADRDPETGSEAVDTDTQGE